MDGLLQVANKEEQRMFATNVFYRNNSVWSIVHHHATLVKPPAPDKSQQQQQQQNAMLGQQAGGLSPQILQQLQVGWVGWTTIPAVCPK